MLHKPSSVKNSIYWEACYLCVCNVYNGQIYMTAMLFNSGCSHVLAVRIYMEHAVSGSGCKPIMGFILRFYIRLRVILNYK
jgi:energy-converting hydrogenase Eha subunit C